MGLFGKSKEEKLFDAAQGRDVAALNAALRAGVNVNCRNKVRQPPAPGPVQTAQHAAPARHPLRRRGLPLRGGARRRAAARTRANPDGAIGTQPRLSNAARPLWRISRAAWRRAGAACVSRRGRSAAATCGTLHLQQCGLPYKCTAAAQP
jgi:hypothetical protein